MEFVINQIRELDGRRHESDPLEYQCGRVALVHDLVGKYKEITESYPSHEFPNTERQAYGIYMKLGKLDEAAGLSK